MAGSLNYVKERLEHGRKTMDNISLIKEGRYTGIILYPDFVVFCIFWHKTIQPSDTLYGGYISFILQKKGYIPNCYKYPQCFQPENPDICKKRVCFTTPTLGGKDKEDACDIFAVQFLHCWPNSNQCKSLSCLAQYCCFFL